MAPTSWRPEYETGIAELDASKRLLIERLAEIGSALDHADSHEFCAKIENFEALARQTFALEKLHMRNALYPSAAKHLEAHDYWSAEVRQQIDDLRTGRTIPAAAFGVIARWLDHHIAHLDADFADAVNAQHGDGDGEDADMPYSQSDAEENFNAPAARRLGDFPVIEWTKKLAVGIEEMDTDHRIMIALYGNIVAAEKAGDADTIARLLRELYIHTEVHFGRENVLMERHAYPLRGPHQAEHRRLLEELACEIEDWRDGDISPLSLATFMHSWLLNHIVTNDIPMANSVRAK